MEHSKYIKDRAQLVKNRQARGSDSDRAPITAKIEQLDQAYHSQNPSLTAKLFGFGKR